jgi:hypothetical protein
MPRRLRIGYPRAVLMSGDTATYALDGQAAGTLKKSLVTGSQGTYAVTGIDATLTPSVAPPVTPGVLSTSFTLTGASTVNDAPFTVGHAFKQGDVPTGSGVVVSNATAQVTPKNYWPDGSLKFAVIAGTANVSTTPATVTLASGTYSSGTALTTEDLKTAMSSQTCSIAFGGTPVSWATTDFDSPHQTLTTGHRMSSWMYRKPIGSDAHLVGWIEIRLYAGGAVEVLPWIENGYLSVTGPTLKSGRATFTLGSTLRYDSINDANTPGGYSLDPTVSAGGVLSMPHHTRAVLIRGGVFSHWLGTNPQVVPAHSRTYLASTYLVPVYQPSSINEGALAALTTTYNPGRLAYTSGSMGGTGYAPDIGLLPNSAALYLVSGDVRAYRSVLSCGFSLANYCIHHRDQVTNRPLLFTDRPWHSNATDTNMPIPSGANSCVYASSHHPAASYLPYLLTGWNWFVEEQQFQVTDHYLARNESYRDGSNYFFYPSAGGYAHNENGGMRAIGWQYRACAMSACLTPDSDTTMRANFLDVLKFNIDKYKRIYDGTHWTNPSSGIVYNIGSNNLGHPSFGSSGGNSTDSVNYYNGTWQSAFFIASVGFSYDMGLVTGADLTKLVWLRDWLYRETTGILGRSGVTSEYSFTRGAVYGSEPPSIDAIRPIGPSNTWLTTWGEVWTNTVGSANTNTGANTIVTGNIDSGNDGLATSYWGNLQPALAYAVSHGAPGALAGYNRMRGSTNFDARLPQFNDIPVWGIKPRTLVSYALPAPGESLSLTLTNTIDSVAPTASGWTTGALRDSAFNQYGGGSFVPLYSTAGAWVHAGSGGHNGPDNLGATVFDFTTATWSYLFNANGVALKSTPPYSWNENTESNGAPWYEFPGTNVPLPGHTYGNHVYAPLGAKGSIVLIARGACGIGATSVTTSHRFDLETRTWSRLSTGASGRSPIDSDGVYDGARNRIWFITGDQHIYTNARYLDLADGVFKNSADGPSPSSVLSGYERVMLHDTYLIKNEGSTLWLFDPDLASAGWVQLTVTGTLPNGGACRWARYSNGNWYAFNGFTTSNTIIKIVPPANPKTGTWACSPITLSGPALPLWGTSPNHYSRFFYVPAIDCLAWISGVGDTIIIMKPGS